jgi:ADP-ribosyl-[dinitrogen reductase] hydrolase
MSVLPGIQTSQSSPLRIAEVHFGDNNGALGLTFCPGKKDLPYRWNRSLSDDLNVIRNWGASTVVTLIEDHEFEFLQVTQLGEVVRNFDMDWIHLPIRDVDIPDQRFEKGWKRHGPEIHGRIQAGHKILIHCRGGVGRTGLVAARILVERGYFHGEAIRRVREVRRGAIETRAQENYVLALPAPPQRAPNEQD